MLPKSFQHIHFIGIGGSGMMPLALHLTQRGYTVTGSDSQLSQEKKNYLKTQGIQAFDFHHPSHVSFADLAVYSSAIPADHVERHHASHGCHRSDLLAYLAQQYKSIIVTGTCGKSTTSSLIAHILTQCGIFPHAIIGATVLSSSSSLPLDPKASIFVAEADESDETHLKFEPHVGVLTQIGLDHLDHYKTAQAIEDSFEKFLKKSQKIVMPHNWKSFSNLGKSLTFGMDLGDYAATNIIPSQQGTFFSLKYKENSHSTFLPLLGNHNVTNALAALAALDDYPLEPRLKAMETFPGLSRRMEFLIKTPNLVLVDDYAHNPDKIAATLKALRSSWPDHELIAIYEPHRYSRLASLWEATLEAFHDADEVLVLPIYAAGEKNRYNCKEEVFAKDLKRRLLKPCGVFSCLTSLVAHLDNKTNPRLIVTLGAGILGTNLAKKLQELYKKRSLPSTDCKKISEISP